MYDKLIKEGNVSSHWPREGEEYKDLVHLTSLSGAGHYFPLKNTSYYTRKKSIYLGIAKNCNSGHASYDKTIGEFGKQGELYL